MINHNIHKHTTSTLVLSLTILTILSGAILASPKASADTSANVNISVTVPSVCSLTANPDTLTATIYPGHGDTIGTTNIKAVCNDPAGLAVYAVGYTDSTYGNTDLVSTVGGTTNVIHTNVTPSGTPSASEWYMTLTAVSGTYAPTIVSTFEDTANAIPATYTKVAYRNTMTDMGENANGANFTAAFDAYIAENQAAGTYTGKVKFLLVHPAVSAAEPGQICYDGNGEDVGAMACQTTIDGSSDGFNTVITVGSLVTLRAPNFSKSGYGFTGWNTKEDGTGTQYGPNETITFTQDMHDNGLALFANWKAAEIGVTMQTFDDSISPYSTAPNGAVIALRDERDNDVYAVAKLPYYGNSGDTDGRWWMIENLRLDYDANITTSNTRSNDGAWGEAFVGLAQPEYTNIAITNAANSRYSTANITGTNQKYRFPRYNDVNTGSRVANQTSASENIYSYGNYYTWAAAIADTTSYTDNNQSITATALCPTGWYLPIGGDKDNFANSEWWKLTRAIVGTNPANYDNSSQPNYASNTEEGANASKAMRRYPTNLVYSGDFYNSSTSSRGTHGVYWSSTVRSGNSVYRENITSVSNNPSTDSTSKASARPIRCIAQ